MRKAPHRGSELAAQGSALGKETTQMSALQGQKPNRVVMLLPRQGVFHYTQTPQGVALGYELVGPAGRPLNKTVKSASSAPKII
jgi:hypothetical protein